jgi:hypothetical protein
MMTMEITEISISLALVRVFAKTRTMKWEEVEAFTKRIGLVWHKYAHKENWKWSVRGKFAFKDVKEAEDLASAIRFYHGRMPSWSICNIDKEICIVSSGYNA